MILQKSIVSNQCTCYAVFAIAMFDYRYPREIFNGNHSQPWWIQVATSPTTLSATALTSSTRVLAAECEFYWQGTGDFSWTRVASDVFFLRSAARGRESSHFGWGIHLVHLRRSFTQLTESSDRHLAWVPTDSQHGCKQTISLSLL